MEAHNLPESPLPLFPHLSKTNIKMGLCPSRDFLALGSVILRKEGWSCSSRLPPGPGGRVMLRPVPGALSLLPALSEHSQALIISQLSFSGISLVSCSVSRG